MKARLGVQASYRSADGSGGYTYGGYPNFTNIYGIEGAAI